MWYICFWKQKFYNYGKTSIEPLTPSWWISLDIYIPSGWGQPAPFLLSSTRSHMCWTSVCEVPSWPWHLTPSLHCGLSLKRPCSALKSPTSSPSFNQADRVLEMGSENLPDVHPPPSVRCGQDWEQLTGWGERVQAADLTNRFHSSLVMLNLNMAPHRRTRRVWPCAQYFLLRRLLPLALSLPVLTLTDWTHSICLHRSDALLRVVLLSSLCPDQSSTVITSFSFVPFTGVCFIIDV